MIRLVTQFDSVETRAAAATPTCGGCCCSCCCCCLATAITSSAYTAMNLRVHARRLKDETGKSPSPWPEILGFFALPIAVGFWLLVGGGTLGLVGAAVTLVGAAVILSAWFLVLVALYRWVGSRRAWLPALATPLLAGVAAAFEFVLGLALLLDGSDGAAVAYLVVALVFSALAIVAFYRRLQNLDTQHFPGTNYRDQW